MFLSSRVTSLICNIIIMNTLAMRQPWRDFNFNIYRKSRRWYTGSVSIPKSRIRLSTEKWVFYENLDELKNELNRIKDEFREKVEAWIDNNDILEEIKNRLSI